MAFFVQLNKCKKYFENIHKLELIEQKYLLNLARQVRHVPPICLVQFLETFKHVYQAKEIFRQILN